MTITNDKTPFRLAIPKKGRLAEALNEIFQRASLCIAKEAALDYGTIECATGQIETVFQRDKDALQNIQDGLIDIAIVGKDKYIEARSAAILAQTQPKLELCGAFEDVATCSLKIAAPEHIRIKSPRELSGLNVVTSYPATLRAWLQSHNVEDCNVIYREGGVEDYVRLGLADAVCDIVQTGKSLNANHLLPCLTIYDSSAVLVSSNTLCPEKKALAAEILSTMLVPQPAFQAA